MKSIIQLASLIGLPFLCSTAYSQNIIVTNNGISNDTIEFLLENTSEDTIWFNWIVIQDGDVLYTGDTSSLPSETLSMKFPVDTQLQNPEYDMEIDENASEFRLTASQYHGPAFSFGPNPATELIRIQCPSCEETPTQIELIRMDGQSAWRGNWSELHGGVLPIGTLPAGLYFLRMQDAHGGRRIRQFSKIH